MGDPTEAEVHRVASALHPFVDEWRFSINPEDLMCMAWAVLKYGISSGPLQEGELERIEEEARLEVERYVAERIAFQKEAYGDGGPEPEPPRQWPERFRVTLKPPTRQYTIATRRGREGAAAIALGAGTNEPTEIEIEELGPVERSHEGQARPEAEDRLDRREW